MQSQKMSKKAIIKLVATVFAVALIVPFLAFSSQERKIYVDGKASGTEDGSAKHPYKTIKQAMEKANEDTEIHVANGTYRENVSLRKGVELYGENKDKTVIEAKSDDKPTVFMYHKTKINKFTIKKGKDGVRVDDGARVSIIKCSVRDNDDDGIHIEGDGTDKKSLVSISENEIQKNDGAGIYSERRRLSIVENEIEENGKDGIDLAKGTVAWIAENVIRDNHKSGLKMRLDRAEIWTKSNSISSNDRDGVEISWNGEAGRIDIAKSKIRNNHNWGVARVQRMTVSGGNALWGKYLTFDIRNQILNNRVGAISPIIFAK